MADNNNKISIDVEINASGQQQINQYKAAFDGLRTSINNLSSPISKLDSDIAKLNDTLTKTDTQQQNVKGTLDRLKDGISDSITIFKYFEETIKFVRAGVISLEASLTAGLSIIIAFLPEIINFTTALFKGKDAINAAAQNLKNLNEVMKSANTEAAGQITRLDLLRPC